MKNLREFTILYYRRSDVKCENIEIVLIFAENSWINIEKNVSTFKYRITAFEDIKK